MEAGDLEVLRKQYIKFKDKMVATDNIIKMVDYVLKNNLFEFDCKLHQQISKNGYWDQICAALCLHFDGLY